MFLLGLALQPTSRADEPREPDTASDIAVSQARETPAEQTPATTADESSTQDTTAEQENTAEPQGEPAGNAGAEAVAPPLSPDKPEAKAEPYVVKSESPKEFSFPLGDACLVVHAKLSDVVELGLAPYLIRAVDEAEQAQACALIIEIDTPGGRVDAAVQIKDALLRSKVPTVAFINKQAISAGAFIAYAHDYILWSTGATMGAATPIQMGADQTAQPVEEKMTSYMRGVMAATAEAKGRDPFVAECMVDATLDLPEHAPEGKLLTARLSEARALGLWDGSAENMNEVMALLGLDGARIVEVKQNWAETVARVVTHPVTSGILMSVGMLGLLIEFYTPGFGFAGIVGIVSLVIFFAGHLVVNLAGLEELLLLIAGGILLAVEVFVLPGFGVAGVLGVIFVAASLALALVGMDITVAWDLGFVGKAMTRLLASVAGAGVGVVLAIRFLPEVKPVSRLILGYSLTKEVGAVAGDPVVVSGSLLGQVGRTLTDLRPVGRALINGQKFDVSTSGEYLPRGTRIRVSKVDGPLVVVEPDSSVEEA